MSNKIIVPQAFDDFFNWTLLQKEEENSNFISGNFEWRSNKNESIMRFFGVDVSDRFGVFGAGSMGNLYAFWIDDENKQKIVHLGSEGDNLLVLGNNFVEFLQYLSVGYADPDRNDFNLTNEQILERDKIDHDNVNAESLNEYHEKYAKPLGTEEGIKKLFGDNIDDATLQMLLEINKNADLSFMKNDNATIEKQKEEAREKEKTESRQLKKLQHWLNENFKVELPKKGADIINVEDKSFENWVNNITRNR